MEKTEKPVFEPMPETPAEPASTVSESAGQPAASLAEAKKNILVGLLWCVGGLAFSFISYYLTEAGGRYVIATGAILWGAWQAIMGLYVWLKIKHGAGEYAAFWRMLATAVCTALLIGYLTVLSTQLVDEGGELPLLDTEQTYDCTDLGLRIRIPAGYSALEESIEPETDSTYARYTMYVLDGEWEFNIDALQDVFDPEAKSIADLSDYCASRDSAYYDGGIIKASRPPRIERHRHAVQRRPPDRISGIRIHGLRPQTGAVAHHRRHQLPLEGIRQDEYPPTRRRTAPRH